MEQGLDLLTAPYPPVPKGNDPIQVILSTFSRNIEYSMKKGITKINDVALDEILKTHEKTFHLLEFLKIHYGNRLFKNVDDTVKSNIVNVRQLVLAVLSEKPQDVLDEAIKKVEDNIPSKWWIPRVTNITPRFIVLDPNKETKTRLTIQGNFTYAERFDCTPQFVFDHIFYLPEFKSKTELTFLIGMLPKTTDQQNFTCLSGELRVMWQKGKMSWTTSSYKILFGCLPNYPGRLRVLYAKSDCAMKPLRSMPVKYDRNGSWATDHEFLKSTSGYQIVPDTFALHWLKKEGRLGHEFASQGSSELVYNYWGQHAKGVFQISCEEAPSLDKQRVETISNLIWGGKINIIPKIDEKIHYVIFEAFTGDTFKFFPFADNSNSLIKVNEVGENGFILEAMSVDDLYASDFEKINKRISKEALEMFAIQNASK